MNLRRFSTLQLALGVSVAVHAVLLTVRFVDPESFNRVFEDTPLEVILVNAKTNEKPDKAKVIAQNSMAGGGDAEKGRATSPLPPSALTEIGDTQEQTTAHRLQNLQEQQTLLLAEVKSQLAALPPPEPRPSPQDAAQDDRESKRRQLIKLLAEIERRINQENARPRKRYISPSAREEVYALYYDSLRHAIEDRGTEHFPTQGGKKLYGELTMIVTVNHDGRVLGTEVVESSGNPTLHRQADQILVVSRFKFTRDETLEAHVSSSP